MIYDRENTRWIEYKKLSSGYTAMISFIKNYRYEIGNENDYVVVFAIAHKKKILRSWLDGISYGNLDLIITGNCGTEGMIWAFQMIKYFIENHLRYGDRLVVFGSDTRRQRIYKHFLVSRLGLKEIHDSYYGTCIIKTINIQK